MASVNETFTDKEAASEMKLLMEIIRSVRNIRAEVNTPLSKKVPIYHFMLKMTELLQLLEVNKAISNDSVIQKHFKSH